VSKVGEWQSSPFICKNYSLAFFHWSHRLISARLLALDINETSHDQFVRESATIQFPNDPRNSLAAGALLGQNTFWGNRVLLYSLRCKRVAMNNQEPLSSHIRPVGLQCPSSASSLVHGRTHTSFDRESTRPVQSTITLNAALAMSRSYSIETHEAAENVPTTDRARTRAPRQRQASTLTEILNEALAITADTDSLVLGARPGRAQAE
jgi:hypothetical protein